jgi:hypothetical protein
MFTAEQYRAKAIEYSKLVRTANGPNEVREFQRLERSFSELADNAQWMTDNHGKMVQATEQASPPLTPDPPVQSISQQ